MIDKRIILIAALVLLAIVLTAVRESSTVSAGSFSFIPVVKKDISGDEVISIADSALSTLGIDKKNIRHLKNRNDIRVLFPSTFDPIMFIKTMNILLEEYHAEVVSSENNKEKTTLVHIKHDGNILKSFMFIPEPVTAAKKGVSPSQQKKQTR